VLQLEPGARVRVTAPQLGIEKQATTFQTLRGDTLIVVADSATYCPLASVTRLEVHRGRQGHVWLGAGIGSAVGAVAGVVTGVLVCKNDWLCSDDYMGLAVLAGAGIGGVAGGLLGAGVGALIKTDRWEEVPLDRLRVSLVPRREGVALGISLAF
jgi:hypothetical protein